MIQLVMVSLIHSQFNGIGMTFLMVKKVVQMVLLKIVMDQENAGQRLGLVMAIVMMKIKNGMQTCRVMKVKRLIVRSLNVVIYHVMVMKHMRRVQMTVKHQVMIVEHANLIGLLMVLNVVIQHGLNSV